ncbi:outer membrane protein [Winogradskyella ursingii]|uniref:outer membrane protein n=1 Tax=Winogradskyella ursingii TaxID=2686079 RepID=UPI0015CD3F6F|nr:outer membrane beta-barrel protein [Winogradskyella ursingii]
MRQNLCLLFGLIVFSACAQNSKFNIEVSYPITFGDNFVEQNYNGVVDLGLKYRFADLKVANLGASINAGYLKNSKEDRVQPIDVNLYTVQPRIFAELNLAALAKLHPSAGIGYSVLIFKPQYNRTFNASPNEDETLDQSGFNINFGLAYDITNKLFIQARYDFVKINVEDNVPDVSYNTNVNVIKIGLGYHL